MLRCLPKSSVTKGRRISAPVAVEIAGADGLPLNPSTLEFAHTSTHAIAHNHTQHAHEINHKHEHNRASTYEHAPTYTHTAHRLFCCARDAQTCKYHTKFDTYARTFITFFHVQKWQAHFLPVHVIVFGLQGVKFRTVLRHSFASLR